MTTTGTHTPLASQEIPTEEPAQESKETAA